jgi:membrane-associated phospholipid phosphatase
MSLFVGINTRYSTTLDGVMEQASRMGEGWWIALFGFVFFLFKPFRNPWFFFGAILCTVIPSLVTQLIKFYIGAPRPLKVYGHLQWIHHLHNWPALYQNSFPSGHTTGAFSFFAFLSCMLPSKYNYWAILFFALALATGYSRVYLAAHFFVDVYVGSIIGTSLSFAVCMLLFYFKTLMEERRSV